MRALLFTSLKNSSAIANLVGERLYEQSALGVGGVPALPDKPYMVLAELDAGTYPEVRETSLASSHIFQVFVYDRRGSFVRIEQALQAVRETVRGLPNAVSSSGARCLDTEWQGTSADITDDEYDACVKYATFRMTGTR